MLSSDLEMLRRQLRERKNGRGKITLPPDIAAMVDLIMGECIDQALHLQASRVQRWPTLIDVSDPKIEMFPTARRTIPINTPDGGDAA